MSFTDAFSSNLSFPVLVADIGGTNARFALVSSPDAELEICSATATADYPDISAAIEANLHHFKDLRPKTAIVAVAGPVTGDRIPLTNAAWVIEPLDMIVKLGLEDVIILNDFEAQALALAGYKGADIEAIGTTTPSSVDPANATKFVLGPGTGLGAAAMIRAAGTWVPVPGEGGHVEIGPVDAEDYQIWPHIEFYGGRLGAEQILSGTGLPRLARGVAASKSMTRSFNTASDITAAASDGDEVAVTTLQVFSRALGRLAGDFALSLLARGGVYLTGGVTARIDQFLIDGSFRRSFEAKAPHDALMRSIPTFIVRHPNPALEGLAAYARMPSAFAVETGGRIWNKSQVLTSAG
ncbi:glucokinase [Roseibium sp. CAU 1637]|uniref:Glucokinase n=1 Tax=Roseibium limicola TaxID=2816037 RepID=A0A939EN83_9HYPH|nr:glucokinase [Roseibium limicola]MBO0345659.1 glucokinase [Roseibium limicola]